MINTIASTSNAVASTSNAVASATLEVVQEEEDQSAIEVKQEEASAQKANIERDALKDRLIERSEQIARDVERLRSAYQSDKTLNAMNMLEAAEALEIHAAAFAEIVKDL